MSSNLLHVFVLLILSLLTVAAIIQDFYWRDYIPGDIPSDALEGAPGRYIGQVYHNEGNVVATIFPYNNTAITDWAGGVTYRENIKILCTRQPRRFYWEYVDFTNPNGQEMKNAVKGGYQMHLDTFVLYIGKASHQGEWKIGKAVQVGSVAQGLHIWHAVLMPKFYLLKYNSTVV